MKKKLKIAFFGYKLFFKIASTARRTYKCLGEKKVSKVGGIISSSFRLHVSLFACLALSLIANILATTEHVSGCGRSKAEHTNTLFVFIVIMKRLYVC